MEQLITLVLVVCLACSAVSTLVAVVIWQRWPSMTELRGSIDAGDKAVIAHSDARLDAIRASVARIEAQQLSEEKHALTQRDLAPLHEKINRLAEQQAESRGELTEVARMLREQLRILQSARGGE